MLNFQNFLAAVLNHSLDLILRKTHFWHYLMQFAHLSRFVMKFLRVLAATYWRAWQGAGVEQSRPLAEKCLMQVAVAEKDPLKTL